MDILNTLKEKGKELYLEELDFYVTELETGDYSEVYVKECMDLITSIRNWKKPSGNSSSSPKKTGNLNDILLKPSDLISGYKDPETEHKTIEDKIKSEIDDIRKKSDYNNLFNNYIKTSTVLDEPMIEKLFKYFLPWELEELLVEKKFTEDFLEKYFSELEHSKIARYQYFSEEFFMKHFSDLSYSTVLQKGVNEWRKKANRSSKLDIFLRLKGVTI